VRVMPKIGPFKALAFKTPTVEAERLFTDSFRTSRDRYRAQLDAVRNKTLNLRNTDFDTGQTTRRGEYPLADDTYAELLDRLSSPQPLAVPAAMRADIMRFYGNVESTAVGNKGNKKERKKLEKIQMELAQLGAATPRRATDQKASPRYGSIRPK
jgi:hypothetical protein